MPLNRRLKEINKNMLIEISLLGYGRFLLKRVVGTFIIEFTIVFSLFRGFGTVLAVSKIYKVLPKDHAVNAQSMITNKYCQTSAGSNLPNVLCY